MELHVFQLFLLIIGVIIVISSLPLLLMSGIVGWIEMEERRFMKRVQQRRLNAGETPLWKEDLLKAWNTASDLRRQTLIHDLLFDEISIHRHVDGMRMSPMTLLGHEDSYEFDLVWFGHRISSQSIISLLWEQAQGELRGMGFTQCPRVINHINGPCWT